MIRTSEYLVECGVAVTSLLGQKMENGDGAACGLKAEKPQGVSKEQIKG